jgi:hypothetical protein
VRVCFLHDDPGYIGGAELTMREFRDAAPSHVTFTEPADAQVVVVGNCTSMTPDDVKVLCGRRVVRYYHDLGAHERPAVREWFAEHAEHVFTSPLHREAYGADGAVIPPALALCRPPSNGRAGTCSVAAWMNPGKGGQLLSEYAARNGVMDVYGAGPYVPRGDQVIAKGALSPEQVIPTLARYRRFVFLPSALEPFGRCVVEAWAAGCEVVTNELVGARYFIEGDPEPLRTAAEDFWGLVLG